MCTGSTEPRLLTTESLESVVRTSDTVNSEAGSVVPKPGAAPANDTAPWRQDRRHRLIEQAEETIAAHGVKEPIHAGEGVAVLLVLVQRMDHCASRLVLIISDLYCCKSSTDGSWFKDIDLHPGSKFLPQPWGRGETSSPSVPKPQKQQGSQGQSAWIHGGRLVLCRTTQHLDRRQTHGQFRVPGRMFSCSADCCDRPADSMSVVHRCIERCHTPLAQAQGLVTSELEKFQLISQLIDARYRQRAWQRHDRLSRCTMHCNDKAKDLFDSGAKEPAVRSLMDSCVGTCVDDHINLIPSMTRRIKDNLNSIQE
ncbi:Protein FAM136A [Liparis tanakae]|uniref:Protein FAM136A n=1 Tax=Liparis tanakae TaxID=230148 RepID=A0A4Z2HZY0_9TELE|nr:Protein FAM136A [Liparis tanakae]